MRVVVITGSTKGIGLELAKQFLAEGCAVVVSGRHPDAVSRLVQELYAKYGAQRVAGFPCDVCDPEQLRRLWFDSIAAFRRVDIWVNNAGVSNQQNKAWQVPNEDVATVIQTNLLGVIYGSQVAVRGMLSQGWGALYNMEGMGSDGRMHDGLAPYGTTKYGVHYFTRALTQELKGTPLIVGSIRPGMLITDLITEQYRNRPEDWERAKRIFNIIAHRPEMVAPVLVDRILANKRSGAVIVYEPAWRLFWRFMSAPFKPRNVFEAETSERQEPSAKS